MPFGEWHEHMDEECWWVLVHIGWITFQVVPTLEDMLLPKEAKVPFHKGKRKPRYILMLLIRVMPLCVLQQWKGTAAHLGMGDQPVTPSKVRAGLELFLHLKFQFITRVGTDKVHQATMVT